MFGKGGGDYISHTELLKSSKIQNFNIKKMQKKTLPVSRWIHKVKKKNQQTK